MKHGLIWPDDAARGTVVFTGHPGNRRWLVKGADGHWRHIDTGALVGADEFSAGWDVVSEPDEDEIYASIENWSTPPAAPVELDVDRMTFLLMRDHACSLHNGPGSGACSRCRRIAVMLTDAGFTQTPAGRDS